MSTPVPLRVDFDTIGLRMLARRSRDPYQTRRLLALAEIYDGGSRPDAARIGGVGVGATGLSVSTPRVLYQVLMIMTGRPSLWSRLT